MDGELRRLAAAEYAQLVADGLTAKEIASEHGIPERTVYWWLAKPEVQEMARREIEYRHSIRRRFYMRHVRLAFEFAARVAVGEAKVETPEQMEMLRYFMGADPPPAVTVREEQPRELEAPAQPQLGPGPVNVFFGATPAQLNGHAERVIDVEPQRPRVIPSEGEQDERDGQGDERDGAGARGGGPGVDRGE